MLNQVNQRSHSEQFVDRLVCIEEAAKLLGRSVTAVRHLERKGLLEAVRNDRRVQFLLSEIMRYQQGRRLSRPCAVA